MKEDMRKFMNIMRKKDNNASSNPVNVMKLNETNLMRNMVGKMRTYLKEDFGKNVNKATVKDQKREEEKFMNNFRNDEINVDFLDIEIYDDKVFWGGTINTKSGTLDWIYMVSSDDTTNGFIPNEESNFDVTIPENKEIMNKLKSYFDEFFKYWRDNELLDK